MWLNLFKIYAFFSCCFLIDQKYEKKESEEKVKTELDKS